MRQSRVSRALMLMQGIDAGRKRKSTADDVNRSVRSLELMPSPGLFGGRRNVWRFCAAKTPEPASKNQLAVQTLDSGCDLAKWG